MAYMIDMSTCNACGACRKRCPNEAISKKGKIFKIDPDKCKECVGSYPRPQCVDACASDSCIRV
jgi:ferredoxin